MYFIFEKNYSIISTHNFVYVVEISDENKQALLELISFFNETEEFCPQFIEEKWFSQANKDNFNVKKTWKLVPCFVYLYRNKF